MEKSMIFFDIDGTILPETGEPIPESTFRAIRLAQENGHLTFINSGRTMIAMPQEIKEMGFDGYLCGCGTYIYLHDELLFSSTVPHDLCMETMELARALRIPIVFEENDQISFDGASPVVTAEVRDLCRHFQGKDIMRLPKEERNNYTFDKFVILLSETESHPEPFFEFCNRHFVVLNRGGGMYEIIQKEHSKASAIQFLSERLDIPLERCYAIGDSTNDLSMLQYVPNGIAMGNSMKEILPYCDYQTTHILDNGIWNALKHYHLI